MTHKESTQLSLVTMSGILQEVAVETFPTTLSSIIFHQSATCTGQASWMFSTNTGYDWFYLANNSAPEEIVTYRIQAIINNRPYSSIDWMFNDSQEAGVFAEKLRFEIAFYGAIVELTQPAAHQNHQDTTAELCPSPPAYGIYVSKHFNKQFLNSGMIIAAPDAIQQKLQAIVEGEHPSSNTQRDINVVWTMNRSFANIMLSNLKLQMIEIEGAEVSVSKAFPVMFVPDTGGGFFIRGLCPPIYQSDIIDRTSPNSNRGAKHQSDIAVHLDKAGAHSDCIYWLDNVLFDAVSADNLERLIVAQTESFSQWLDMARTRPGGRGETNRLLADELQLFIQKMEASDQTILADTVDYALGDLERTVGDVLSVGCDATQELEKRCQESVRTSYLTLLIWLLHVSLSCVIDDLVATSSITPINQRSALDVLGKIASYNIQEYDSVELIQWQRLVEQARRALSKITDTNQPLPNKNSRGCLTAWIES